MARAFIVFILLLSAIAVVGRMQYEKFSALDTNGDLRTLLELDELGEDVTSRERVIYGGESVRRIGSFSEESLTGEGVLRWTNTYREQAGVSPLRRSDRLDAAAIIKLNDMFERQYFEHVAPDGKNVSDVVSGVGYEYIIVGENLALGHYRDDKDLVDAWMDSPGHRENIVKNGFEEIGVAVGYGEFEGKKVWLAVQKFGRPRSSCPAPNSDLERQIEEERANIELYERSLAARRAEIDEMERNDRDAYNAKVDEHNALVRDMNNMIANVKELIAVYNQQVQQFNDCLDG